ALRPARCLRCSGFVPYRLAMVSAQQIPSASLSSTLLLHPYLVALTILCSLCMVASAPAGTPLPIFSPHRAKTLPSSPVVSTIHPAIYGDDSRLSDIALPPSLSLSLASVALCSDQSLLLYLA